MIVRPTEPRSGESAMTVPADIAWRPVIRPTDWTAIGRDVTASIYPHAAWAETVAAKIADLRVFDVIKDAIPTGDVTSGPRADAESALDTNSVFNSNPVSDPSSKDLTPIETQTAPSANRSKFDDAVQTAQPPAPAAEPIASSDWPMPNALLAQLNRLSAEGECKNWVDNVKALCLEVCRTPPTEPQRAAPFIRQLQSLADVADTLAGTLKSNRAEELRRVRYALQRRLAVWNAVFNSGRQAEVFADVAALEQQYLRLTNAVNAAQAWTRSMQYSDDWRNYLLLDDLQALIDAHEQTPSDESRQLVRKCCREFRRAPPAIRSGKS